MYSIQSYQKKITNKFWKQETKRRNSITDIKKDVLSSNGDIHSSLNYDFEEENKLITEYNLLKRNGNYNKEATAELSQYLDFYCKLRPIRTIKMFQMENTDKTNAKLLAFNASYNKDFTYLKSKYEGCNRMHLQNLVKQDETSISDAPIYEISLEPDSSSLTGNMMEIWESQSLSVIPSDPLITGLLNDLSSEAAVMQSIKLRQKFRQSELFNLYRSQDMEKQIELQNIPEFPREVVGKSFKVHIKSFKLDYDVEPIFGNMCLYDLKVKKKISENFYFDFNSSHKYRMLDEKVQTIFFNRSPQADSCIFHVDNISDVFLVIRLEKILQQGDVNEIADSYLKDEKHKSKVKSQIEWACKNLAKHRMPFGFYAISLQKDAQNSIFVSSSSIDNCSINSGSFSIKSSKISTNSKKHPLESISTKSASQSQSKDLCLFPENLLEEDDDMKTPMQHITNFYRQESEKMSDEDLFKWFLDCKKPGSNSKKTKPIPCQMLIEITQIDEMNSNEFILNPEQIPLANKYQSPRSSKLWYTDRPIIDILEFPTEKRLAAHAIYRNLLYVFPKSVNFSSRPGSLRNITIKIQFCQNEGEKSKVLKSIYNKFNGGKLTGEAFTKVLYHVKNPEFNDEIKIQLPDCITKDHFLLFTFYHVSCQPNKKSENLSMETLIGYSWLPLLENYILQASEHSLLISTEKPSPKFSSRKPDLQSNIENIHWLESHKELFRVSIQPISTIHSDNHVIESFNNSASYIRYNFNNSPNDQKMESIKKSTLENLKILESVPLNRLIQFSSVIFDNLLWFSLKNVFPDHIQTHFLNILASLVNRITKQSMNKNENYNRDPILVTYVTYAACLPGLESESEFLRSWNSYILSEKSEKGNSSEDAYLNSENYHKIVGLFHEDFLSRILQCIDNGIFDFIMDNLWFFLELLTRGMREHFHFTMANRNSESLSVFSQLFINKLMKLIRFAIQHIDRYIQFKGSVINENVLFGLPLQEQKKCQHLIRNIALFYKNLLTLLNLDIIRSLIVDFIELINNRINNEKKDIIRLLILLKLEFLRIMSDTEFFLVLNGFDFNQCNSLIQSQLSDLHTIPHFFLSLIFTELKLCLKSCDNYLQSTAIHIVWNLIASHESDIRYTDPGMKSNISYLYLPFVSILFDSIKYVISSKTSQIVCNDNCSASSLDYKFSQNNENMAQSTYSYNPCESVDEDTDNTNNITSLDLEGNMIVTDNSRHLLICFLWILKNLEMSQIVAWLSSLSSFKINKLLQLILLAIVNFEFKISKDKFRSNIDGCKSTSLDFLYSGDMKRQISSISAASRKINPENYFSILEGKLCLESIFIILDSLDTIIKVFETSQQSSHIIINTFKIIIRSLHLNQSVAAVQSILAFQRLLIKKYYKTIFDEAIYLCGDLCRALLKLAGSNLKEVRSHSVASLYMLMRYNFQLDNTFARIKLQITMALSQLVWDREDSKQKRSIEFNLNSSLRTIISYTAVEMELHNDRTIDYEYSIDYSFFATQVEELMLNLHTILTDTVKMRQFEDDPEMQIDLMSRIAKGYQNSPDLRLSWVQRMTQKHKKLNNKTEAGMCWAHCAAIVAEYLGMKEPLPYMPVGCVQIADALGSNLLEESAISDDVVSPDEDGVCCDELFSQTGLIKLIHNATKCFKEANMFELIPRMYRIVLPILEEHGNFSRLSKFHNEIKEAYDNIQNNVEKRIFATYFRVGFYGDGFKELNQQEYIYKEPPYTKLPEISSRIESFYSTRFGKDRVSIVKDSNIVNQDLLEKDKMFIQITFVEPFFEMAELRRRRNIFDQNYNLKNFVFSTPYTLDGKAHGELKDQYKRKTILTTEKAFPYIKTRIRVIRKYQLDLTPVEVALEDLSRKVEQLKHVLSKDPVDAKYLQMMLQGSIGTTVNQGPVELATSFLSTSGIIRGAHYNKLRLCFKEFLRRCDEGLKKNEYLITPDQQEYQKELKKNFKEISNQLNPLLNFSCR